MKEHIKLEYYLFKLGYTKSADNTLKANTGATKALKEFFEGCIQEEDTQTAFARLAEIREKYKEVVRNKGKKINL